MGKIISFQENSKGTDDRGNIYARISTEGRGKILAVEAEKKVLG